MRKVTNIILMLCLCCGMLVGCEKEVKESSDYDIETNQDEMLQECSYQIPSTWEKKEENGQTYYYPENGSLIVYYSEIGASIWDEGVIENYKSSFTDYEDLEMGEESTIEVAGEKAFVHEYTFKIDGVSYSAKSVLFDCGDGIINFNMNTETASNISYDDDFNNIINSIQVTLPFNKTIVDMENLLATLQAGGECDFSASGVDVLDDGTTMETFIDSTNGLYLTLFGDEENYITLLHSTAKDEAGIRSLASMTVMGLELTSTELSEFLTNFSDEALEAMGAGSENNISEIIGGVRYTLSKSNSSEDKYTFDVQRDNETKDEYEEYYLNGDQEKENSASSVETSPVTEPEIPTEYISALQKAEDYSNIMHMSKQGIYDQLVSEYGEKFSAEAAQYAVDNLQVDFRINALEKAKEYQETMSMSPEAIRDQLTSEYGEKFTQEEADYAIANLP